MTTLANILSILFCLGFIWGLVGVKHRVHWFLCAMIGGVIFTFCIITVPVALIMKGGKG